MRRKFEHETKGEENHVDRTFIELRSASAPGLLPGRGVTTLDRHGFDQLLLADDPAQAVRDALADGSLDELIPEVRREMDVPQRTHYHQYTVLEHSLRTMALMPPRLEERLAGLFHDIGKRRTTTIKERTGEEQYIGHAAAGATMTRPILERLGYDEALVERVVRWIDRHMDLHMAARDGHSLKARRKILRRLGDDLEVLKRLQLADIATMAPDTAAEHGRQAREYHELLASTTFP
jgi:UTP:GlnB (protein PII) uridylyltransferase